jgi:hypothetical protein
MQNGIYGVTVKTPDDEMPASYRYRTEGWPMAEAVLGEPPKDNDDNNSTVHTYSWNSHDAVLTIAKAYHNMKLSSSPTASGSTGTELRDFIEEIGSTTFVGVSGTVDIHPITHDRKNVAFELAALGDGQWKKVGEIDDENGVRISGALTWPGDHTQETFKDHEPPPLQWWMVPVASASSVCFCCIMCFCVHHHYALKRDKRSALENASRNAEASKKKALEDQALVLELKKKQMTYPDKWKMKEAETMEVNGEQILVKMPAEGLIEVKPDTEEYWQVHDQLTRVPEEKHSKKDEKTGKWSNREGMQAWIHEA